MGEIFIKVYYLCECGNEQSITPEGTRPTYHYAIPVYDNVRMICSKCGKDMKLQITKTTQKFETEIIQGG